MNIACTVVVVPAGIDAIGVTNEATPPLSIHVASDIIKPAGTTTTVQAIFTIDAAYMGTSIMNNAEISTADDDMIITNIGPIDVDSRPGDEDGTTPDPNDDDTADTNGGDDYDPALIQIIQDFDLALNKVLSIGQSAMVAPGDPVSFTITVMNQGSVSADNITVTDYIPNGLTFNPLSNTAWIDNLNGTAETILSVANGGLPAGGLAPNGQVTVDIILDVAHNAPQGFTLVNWAEISEATDENGGLVMDSDSTPDDNQSNDTFGGDNVVDNTGGDEDDHDPAEVTIQSFCLLYTSPSPRDRG